MICEQFVCFCTHVKALAIGIRPPPDTQILNKDVKNRVKKQRLIVREAFQTALSASLPEGGEKDDLKAGLAFALMALSPAWCGVFSDSSDVRSFPLQALRASSELCARLRQAVACLGDSDAVAETLKAGFLGGFDPNTVTLAPVAVVKEVEQREVEPIVGKKAGKKGDGISVSSFVSTSGFHLFGSFHQTHASVAEVLNLSVNKSEYPMKSY